MCLGIVGNRDLLFAELAVVALCSAASAIASPTTLRFGFLRLEIAFLSSSSILAFLTAFESSVPAILLERDSCGRLSRLEIEARESLSSRFIAGTEADVARIK